MGNQRQTVINGFNEQIDEMRKEEPLKEVEYIVSLTKFNSSATVVFANRPLAEVKHITLEDYSPNGMTALYDAVGMRIETAEVGEDDVLVYIYTDGDENASSRFDHAQVTTLIKHRQEQGWGITYFGGGIDATRAAASIGVANAVNYCVSNTDAAFAASSNVRATYTNNVKRGLVGQMKVCNLAADVDVAALNTTTTTGTKS